MRISRTLLLSFSFFFLLMYAGMSIVILGLLANELALIIFGVIWEIVTIFIFRNAFPFKMLVGALAGALFGGGGGALLGMFVGHMGDLVVGVVGGAIFGALSGIVIFGIVSHFLLFGWIPIVGPIVGHLLRREGLGLPPVVSEVLSVGAMIIGAIWGVNVAREVYPKIFGPIGGLATVGWIVGMIVGAFVSARMFHSTGSSFGKKQGLFLGKRSRGASRIMNPPLYNSREIDNQVLARILIVEDHAPQATILGELLEVNDFEVAVAFDGVEGVEKARTWQPELILMDLRLPRMDGVTAIKVIRDTPQTANIPIIVITAWQLREPRIEAYEAGAEHLFIKPLDVDKLVRVINKFLSADHQELKLLRDKRDKILEILNNSKVGHDLQEFDLSGAILTGANLLQANLSRANLSEADLQRASLDRADLSLANLTGTDLRNTILSRANLNGARYDQNTKWPEGFDPAAAGAILEE